VLVDSEPEFLAPHPEFFNWADIDAILISNYTCMLALPYITEKTGFRSVPNFVNFKSKIRILVKYRFKLFFSSYN
jgi:hypothetical protein